MAPKKKPIFRQEDFLYELEWSERIEDYFIELLCMESCLGNIKREEKNTLALFSCQEAIQNKFNTFFSYKHLTKKLDLLLKRFKTFHWILAQDGVVYNSSTNIVSAPDGTWDYISKTINFSYAYRPYGEPKYVALKCIFGSEPVNNPNGDDHIIVVSSYGGNTQQSNGILNEVDAEPGADGERVGINAQAFEIVAEQEFANVSRNPPISVINISSGTSDNVDFDMMNYLNYVSDSDGSRDTELSTANSQFVDHPSALGNSICSSRPENIQKLNPFGTPKISTASNKPHFVGFYTPE